MFDSAPEELVQKRLDVCSECAFRYILPIVNTEVCKVCGCPLKNKTKLLNQTCPKGKW